MVGPEMCTYSFTQLTFCKSCMRPEIFKTAAEFGRQMTCPDRAQEPAPDRNGSKPFWYEPHKGLWQRVDHHSGLLGTLGRT